MGEHEREWVIAPDEARIDIAIGDAVSLSPDVRAALEKLADVLSAEHEVQGYMICDALGMKCNRVTITNCNFLITCNKVA